MEFVPHLVVNMKQMQMLKNNWAKWAFTLEDCIKWIRMDKAWRNETDWEHIE